MDVYCLLIIADTNLYILYCCIKILTFYLKKRITKPCIYTHKETHGMLESRQAYQSAALKMGSVSSQVIPFLK